MSAFEDSKGMEEDVEDEPELTTYCSFAATGNNVFNQGIYVCHTCNGKADNLCCCSGCATFCHAGHDVGFVAFGDAYCDCGAANCALYKKTKEDAIEGTLPVSSSMIASATNLLREKSFEEFSMTNVQYDRAIVEAKTLISHSKETFWMPADGTTPRCYAEQLAREIGMAQLQAHWPSSIVPPALFQQALAQCGFEWWVQVKTSEASNEGNDNNDGIDLHYDKDETIAEKFGLGIFPALSTVTYLLSDSLHSAHPTLILDCTAAQPIGAPIQESFLSVPKQGKHVSFNGELLHGAPQQVLSFAIANPAHDNSNPAPTSTNTRITFLVNVWIGHQPASVHRLPESLAHILEEASSMLPRNTEFPVNLTPVSPENVPTTVITSMDVASETLGDWQVIPFVSAKSQWGKDESEAGLELYFWLPTVPLVALHTAQFNRPAPAVTGPKAKKRRNENSNAKQESVLQSSRIIPDGCSSYRILFVGEDCCAKLEYEEDEEGADEFGDNFCGLVGVN